MLLKLYQLFRKDLNAAREFAERDILAVDRRLDVARRFTLSDDEIAIILREDSEAGIRLIRDQVGSLDQDSAVTDMLKDAVERDIRAWLYAIGETSWPGVRGPFVEHVSPTLISEIDVGPGKPVPLELDGWLFSNETDQNNNYKLTVQFHKIGANMNAPYTATVDSIETVNGGPRSRAKIRVELPAFDRPSGIGTYDLYIQQDGFEDFPKGSSRLAAAITVCAFAVPFPKP